MQYRPRASSNQQRQYPSQRHSTAHTYFMAPKPDPTLSDEKQIPQANWEGDQAARLHSQVQQTPPSYSTPQSMQAGPHSGSTDGATYAREIAAAQESERLQAQKSREQYAQQQQAYERARVEALRERERLAYEQRREEYERAVRYQQELQRYQQAVYAAQNRVPKERAHEEETMRREPQTQHQAERWILGNEQKTAGSFVSSPAVGDTQSYDEIKRAKARLRKRLKFEKLKQMEKMRKLRKTTPRPITTAPIPPLQFQRPHESAFGYEIQQQKQQPHAWFGQEIQEPQRSPSSYQAPQPSSTLPQKQSQYDFASRKSEFYVTSQPQYHESQHQLPPPDPYQALYDRIQHQPVTVTTKEVVTTMPTSHSIGVTQPDGNHQPGCFRKLKIFLIYVYAKLCFFFKPSLPPTTAVFEILLQPPYNVPIEEKILPVLSFISIHASSLSSFRYCKSICFRLPKSSALGLLCLFKKVINETFIILGDTLSSIGIPDLPPHLFSISFNLPC
ncbi:unnamed protein product [Gongylonema pulchrum]|uniref:Uncharacterized protein n=1 Tax=Gongylonema pulchrum TaxID=637853 RepID=A0A3P7N4R9_9BILA|nr:unnamed protein product [Gongylonema pulchrum]